MSASVSLAHRRCAGARLHTTEKETALQPNLDVARWKESVDQDHSGAGAGLNPAAHAVHREGLPRVHIFWEPISRSLNLFFHEEEG